MDVFVMVFFSNSSLNFSCTGLMNGNRMERSKRGGFNQTCSKDSIARGVKTMCPKIYFWQFLTCRSKVCVSHWGDADPRDQDAQHSQAPDSYFQTTN